MVKLKHLPCDFIVEEIPNRIWLQKGPFLVLKVSKQERNTDDVAREIARNLHVQYAAVNYAGNKDYHAQTTQYMSVKGKGFDAAKTISVEKVSVEPVGFTNEPLSLGSLEGNHFNITLRDLPSDFHLSSAQLMPNFYGEQRFSKLNDRVGKALVKGEFKQACDLIIKQGGRQKDLLEKMLAKQSHNFVGALQSLPRKVLKIYVHAYQSRIFNELLDSLLEKNSLQDLQDTTLPLVGFATRVTEDLQSILDREDISPRDFIIRALPEASSEGHERDAVVPISELKIGELESDDCFPSRKKITLSFSLPRGSYATEAIRYLQSK